VKYLWNELQGVESLAKNLPAARSVAPEISRSSTYVTADFAEFENRIATEWFDFGIVGILDRLSITTFSSVKPKRKAAQVTFRCFQALYLPQLVRQR
jgi:hypothetical protein